jgi:serine/threonine protein kinase
VFVAVAAGGLPLQQLLRYGGQILSALVELHGQGVVMADLKPQNLLLDEDLDELVVTDFGLSRIVSHTGGSSTSGCAFAVVVGCLQLCVTVCHG